MKIPLSIFVGAFEQLNSGVTWAEIAENWELYAQNWDKGATNLESPLLDLFNDESITIKDVLKDLSDPGKLFTEFSRSFEVPASKKNNKIFKHYYNIDLETTIDSRSLIPAAILMNGVDYKIGNLSVEGIKMSNGKPMSYKVRFFGKLSEIARRIGEDKLNILDFTTYDETTFDAKASFASSLESDLVFPLASRSDRYIIDSVDATAAVGIENTRNIRYVDATRRGEDYGISDDNVIGALKVGRILDSIENLYGITFSGAVRQNYINNLYLWLHRVDKNRSGSELFEGSVGNFTVPLQDALLNPLGEWIGSTSSILRWSIASNNKSYLIRFKGTSSADFTLKMLFNGSEKANSTVTTEWSNFYDVQEYQNITFQGSSSAASTLTVDIEVKEIDYSVLSNPETIFTTSGSISLGGSGEYKVSNNLPDMKISEFLGSIFKMYNIVAEVSDALDISTSHQEAYMSRGTVKDVSQFIDVEGWEVNKPNLYNSIKFSFAEPKTVLEYGYNKVNGKPYGELSYELIGAEGNKLSGEEFEINLKNQRIPGENITDQNDKSLSGIVYYQFSDIKGAEQTIKPIFSYITPVSVDSTKAIAWDNGATVESITSYVMPSSVYTNHTPIVSGVTPVYSGLYFDEEIEELSNSPYNGIGLWSMHYRGLTAAMFEERRRQVTMRAQFNQSTIRNLKLSDTLYIHNNYYTINSVDTNFLTGESVLDLNLIPYNAPREYKIIEETIDNATAGVITYIDGDTGFATSEYIATPNSLTPNKRIGDIRYQSFEIAVPVPDFLPSVIVGLASKTDTQIVINGTVTNVGQPEYTSRGFYWVAGTGTPTVADNVLTIAGTGTGIYSDTVTGLVSGNSYTFVAWATNTVGTAVSAPTTITTETAVTSSVTTDGNTPGLNSATLYGTVTEVGYPVYTSKGFCYIQGTGTPTTANSTVVAGGTSSGAFSNVINSLSTSTLYSYRAFIIQDGVTYYGATNTLTTTSEVNPQSSVVTLGNTPSSNSATLFAEVTSVGSPNVYTEKGFVYVLGTGTPTTANTKVAVGGTGAGVYSTSITGLTEETRYTYRAYIIQDGTTYYGSAQALNTTAIVQAPEVASVTTDNASPGAFDALLYGTVTAAGYPNLYTEKGFVFVQGIGVPTTADSKITIAGTSVGAYVGQISGLSSETQYNYRAYIIHEGTTYYGSTLSLLTTAATYPGVVQTNTPTFGTTTATLFASVTDLGEPAYSLKGFWWAVGNVVPNSGDTEVTVAGTGLGSYQTDLTGLSPLTTYSVRSWVYNAATGYGLGNVINFTTNTDLQVATVTTYDPTYSQADAVFYGNIDYEGNPAYTEKGFYWAIGNVNPTAADTTHIVSGTASGAFQSALITGLSASTTYSVRAYAINSQGTAYGVTKVFTTDAGVTCSPGTLFFDGGVVTGVNATIGTGSISWTAGQCSATMPEVSINITNNESEWQSAEQITSVVMKEGATVINDYTVTVYFSAGLMQLKINGLFPDVNNDVNHNYTFEITASAITLNNIAISLPSTNAVNHASVAVTKNGTVSFPASRDDTAFTNTYLEPVGVDGAAFEYTITYTADTNYEFTGIGNIQPAPTTDNASVSVSVTAYTASTITIVVTGNIQAVSQLATLSWAGTAIADPATAITSKEYRIGTSGAWITYPAGGIDIGTGGQIIQLRVVPDGSVYFAQTNTNLIASFDPAFDYSGDPVVITCTMNSFTGGEGNLTTLLRVYPRASATSLAAFRFDYFDAL